MTKAPTTKQIKAAIAKLEPGKHAHWTEAGEPKVRAVSKVLGTLVTRAAIDKALASKGSTPSSSSTTQPTSGRSGKSRKSASATPSATVESKSPKSKKSAPARNSKPSGKGNSTRPTRAKRSKRPSPASGKKGTDSSTSSTSNARAREEEAPDEIEELAEDEPKTGRGHRNAPPLTVETVVAAMRAASNVRAQAAAKLGVTRGAVTHFIKAHPEIEEALEEINETLLDFAEGKQLTALKAGEPWAIRYFLEHRGAARGWGKKVKLVGDPDNPVHTKSSGPDIVRLLREGKISREEVKQMRDLQRKFEAADGSAGG